MIAVNLPFHAVSCLLQSDGDLITTFQEFVLMAKQIGWSYHRKG